MTPDDAARVLGVVAGSPASEIEAAFVRLARQTHPDRLVGATREELAAASAEFVRISDARLALLQVRARDLAAERPPAPPPSPWPLRVWCALLLPGTVITLAGAGIGHPAALAVIPLVAVVLGLALTGRRWLFMLTVILGLAFAALTVVVANFGGLMALGLLQVPVMAILILRTPGRTGL